MKYILAFCFILLLSILSCKTQKKGDKEVILKNALSIDANNNDVNPNNIQTSNSTITFKNSTNKFKIKKILEYNPNFKTHKYEFPLLTGKLKITEKINSNLAADFLEIEIYNARKSIFENVWATIKNSTPTLTDLTYQINLLSDRVYSVTLSAEGCGAYCEFFSRSYNYDLSNGNKIILDALFNLEERAVILEDLSKKKRAIIEDYITELKKSDNSKNNKEYLATIELYENCLGNLPFPSLEYFDLKIMDSKVILISDRCSAHVNGAIDDLGEYKFTYTKKEIYDLLNDYGKTILKN